MKKAFHPNEDRKITVQKYLSEFGSRLGPDGKPRQRPNSRCPACYEPMKIYGEDRARYDPDFSHLQSQNPPPCPLRNSADHRYEFLTDAPQDSEEGRKIRRDFFDRWAKHWDLMRRLLDRYMDVKESSKLATILQGVTPSLEYVSSSNRISSRSILVFSMLNIRHPMNSSFA